MSNIFSVMGTLRKAVNEQYTKEDANTMLQSITEELENGYTYIAFEYITENKQASRDYIERIKSIQADNIEEANDGYITQEHAQRQNAAWDEDIKNHEQIIEALTALELVIIELEKANLL